MGISKELLDMIIQRILAVAKPERIILFGSAATGNMSRGSDIDLLVLEPALEDFYLESFRIRNALRGLGVPFDVVVMSTGKFEESKTVVGGIAFPAHKYGQVIYAAA